MSKNSLMKEEIKQIVQQYTSKPENLILILQEIQGKYDYLPEEAFSFLASSLEISESRIYGVATFYAQFKFQEPGKHQIRICMGTACHVKEADRLLDTIESELGIKPGETTENHLFTLERVACLGCCALAPVVTIDGEVQGKMTHSKLVSLLDKLEKEEGE